MLRETKRSIAIVLHLNIRSCRDLSMGILRFARPYNWIPSFIDPLPFNLFGESVYDSIRKNNFDGVIGFVNLTDMDKKWRKLGIPIVNIHGGDAIPGLAQVGVDDTAIGRMAADYLIDIGCQTLAMVDSKLNRKYMPRGPAFLKQAKSRNMQTRDIIMDADPSPLLPAMETLRDLPKPVGIFCVNDTWGLYVADACRDLSIAIPDEFALLGCGDDDVRCPSCNPALSSITIPAVKIGHTAADMLNKMLSGGQIPDKPVLFPPLDVHARESTDIVGTQEPLVLDAVRYIRNHVAQNIRVEDILDEMLVSRSWLDMQFRKSLGRSVFAEIQRQRFEHIKSLLRETDMPLGQIALTNDFPDTSDFNRAFRKFVNMPPGKYRQQFRN